MKIHSGKYLQKMRGCISYPSFEKPKWDEYWIKSQTISGKVDSREGNSPK